MLDLISWLIVAGGSYVLLQYLGIRFAPLSSMRPRRLTWCASVLFFSVPLPRRIPLIWWIHTIKDRSSVMLWYSSICISIALGIILCMHFLGGIVWLWEWGIAIRQTWLGILASSVWIYALATSLCIWLPLYPWSSIGLWLIARQKYSWCQSLRRLRSQSHTLRLLLRLGGAWLMHRWGIDLIWLMRVRFDTLYLLVSHLFG